MLERRSVSEVSSGTKIAHERAMPRYSALVAGAAMPVTRRFPSQGYVNPLASCNRVVVTASYHVEGVEASNAFNLFRGRRRCVRCQMDVESQRQGGSSAQQCRRLAAV